MKRIGYMLCVMSTVLFYTSVAVADQHDTVIHNLPNNGEVTLTGTVDKADSEHEFTLSTESGMIIVGIPTSMPILLKIGDSVTVTGIVNKPLLGIFGNYLQASNVKINHHS